MSGKLEIDVDWEVTDQGTPEERACYATIGILCNELRLTEGSDGFVNRVRPAPYLSAYHLAEWFAWNWWRLRWESRSANPSSDWAFSHRMATVGHGYVWPNITIFSDGERTALVAKPTHDRKSGTFRYISDAATVIASTQFESAIDEFIEQVRGQLKAENLNKTNLEKMWAELIDERRSPDIAKRRKFEALLGFDPDEADNRLLDGLISDAEALGSDAANEIAADYGRNRELATASDIISMARSYGFDFSPRDAVRLTRQDSIPRRQDAAAWRRGADAARELRKQLNLADKPVSNSALSQMAGVENRALTDKGSVANLSFAFEETAQKGRIALRSKWETGRRFELARIVGDRIMVGNSGRLFPATRSYTYRQKAQRSFAAELLSPFDVIDDMLRGDYSDEAQQDIAHTFDVSEMTIKTSLMNHKRIEREEIEDSRLGENF